MFGYTKEDIHLIVDFIDVLRHAGITMGDMKESVESPHMVGQIIASRLNWIANATGERTHQMLLRDILHQEGDVRVLNALNRAGFLMVDDLTLLSEADVCALRGIGKESLDVLQTRLRQANRSLRSDVFTYEKSLELMYPDVMDRPLVLEFKTWMSTHAQWISQLTQGARVTLRDVSTLGSDELRRRLPNEYVRRVAEQALGQYGITFTK